jgi:hypothetical protein
MLSNGEDMMTMVCRGSNTAETGSDDDASFNFCEPCLTRFAPVQPLRCYASEVLHALPEISHCMRFRTRGTMGKKLQKSAGVSIMLLCPVTRSGISGAGTAARSDAGDGGDPPRLRRQLCGIALRRNQIRRVMSAPSFRCSPSVSLQW